VAVCGFSRNVAGRHLVGSDATVAANVEAGPSRKSGATTRADVAFHALAVLVARWVGLVSATRRVVIASVSSGGSSADRSSADAYRHSTAYGCAAVNAATVCAAVINASAAHARAANASTICEGIS
jgi:hypothetical protein